MEKGPKIRVIGKANEEIKNLAIKEIEQRFSNHLESIPKEEAEEMKKLEYPKSAKEIAMIDLANEETSRLMREVGVEAYDIPLENYHIIPPELYKKSLGGNDGEATAHSLQQGVLFNAKHLRDNPLFFASVAFHETLHLKAHLSIEVGEKNGKVNKTPYRVSVAVQALQGQDYHHHFSGLHEAIVSGEEKKFAKKLLDNPEFQTEKEWLISEEAKELRKKIAQKRGIPEDDIIWVEKNNENVFDSISYGPQRAVLSYVCAEIQKQFPDKYQSIDDVSKEFLKAHFTGQLLVIARLVERTFGEGSFRSLGNMGIGPSSGVLHFQSLRKARIRQTKL